MAGGIGNHFPRIAAVFQIFGAGFERDAHELVFVGLFLFDHDLALALEHPRHAAHFAQIPAILREHVADLADRAIAVIGGNFGEQCYAAGSVTCLLYTSLRR